LVRNSLPPICIRQNEYNTGDHHEYAPYLLEDDVVIIDPTWFSSLTKLTQELLRQRLQFILEQVDVPHVSQRDDPLLRVIYQTYWDEFDYNVWYSESIPGAPRGVKMLPIDQTIKQLLLDHNPLPDTFVTQIDNLLEGKQQRYFARLSSTSGKAYCPIKPYTSSKQIVSLLQSCKLYADKEYKRKDKPTYLILMPWNDVIDARNEFRLFVVNRRVTAASPQRWGEVHNYSEEELDSFQEILSNPEFVQHVPYATFIADVYISSHQQCHLIELNAFGPHSGVSSSLFHWIEDYDLLHGNTQHGEFRYLSIIKI